jgi:hypothetical protein
MRKVSAIVVCIWSMNVFAQTQTSSADRANGEAVPAAAAYMPKPIKAEPKRSAGIHWGPLFREWLTFVTIEQTERIVRESKTRDQLSGPFFRDWFDSVSDYHFDNWNDGGHVFTSYLAHPSMGAVSEAIFWQNNDRVRFSEQDFHSATYRNALLQAFAFATFDAVMWKMGPLSESSIGNVGLPVHWWDKDCKEIHIPCVDRTGMSDMVMNEVGGTGLTILFQFLDKHVQKHIEANPHSRFVIDTTRILTNPTQSFANLVRFRRPWFRDNRDARDSRP